MKKLLVYLLLYLFSNCINVSAQIDCRIQLKNLVCIKESDGHGHSEPYMWTMIIYRDSRNDLNTNLFTTRCNLYSDGARGEIIKYNRISEIKTGDIVNIPPYIGSYRQTLIGDINSIVLGIIVLLIEEDDFPPSEYLATGQQTFCDSLPTHLSNEIINFYTRNQRFPFNMGMLDQDFIDNYIPIIENSTYDDILKSMGLYGLSWLEEFKIGFNSIVFDWDVPDPDDIIGFGYWFAQNSDLKKLATNFRISIMSEDSTNQYEINGEFQIPEINPCFLRNQNVDLLKDLIKRLQRTISNFDQLYKLPDEPTPEDDERKRKAFEELKNNLKKAQDDLVIAESLLGKCKMEIINPEGK